MGTNSPVYDVVADYAKKTTRDLERIKLKLEQSVEKYPKIALFNEHLEFVRMTLAERIGK